MRWQRGLYWMLGVVTASLVLALFGGRHRIRGMGEPVAQAAALLQGGGADPCSGCGVYSGDIYDLHVHLPLAACRPGISCDECDQPEQEFFAGGLVNGDMPGLGVVHVALQGAANDNYPDLPQGGSSSCVFHENRDAERLAVSQQFPGAFSPMLDGFDPANPNGYLYVMGKLDDSPLPWKGVGEVHLRSKAYHRKIHANSPGMISVYKQAAAAGIPVFIHWDPRYDGVQFKDTFPEIEAVLSHPDLQDPPLRLVWFHHEHHQCQVGNDCPLGSCSTDGMLSQCVRTLLQTYPPNTGQGPPHAELYLGWEFDPLSDFLDAQGKLTLLGPELLTFSKQIVIASDIGIRKPLVAGTCDAPGTTGLTWRYGVEEKNTIRMEELICNVRKVLTAVAAQDSTAADDIARGNAQRLLGP